MTAASTGSSARRHNLVVPPASPEADGFEWDEGKREGNLAKHGVSFHEAATVFGDPLAITYFDPDHSDEEDRFLTFGQSSGGDLLVVAHADRKKRLRVISDRRMTHRERKSYEEGQDKGRRR